MNPERVRPPLLRISRGARSMVLAAALVWAWGEPARAAETRPEGAGLLFPVDGLILTASLDCSPEPGMQVAAVGVAPPGATVRVNGRAARLLAAADLGLGGRLDTLGLSIRRDGAAWTVRHPAGTARWSAGRWSPFVVRLSAPEPVLDLEVEVRSGQGPRVLAGAAYVDPDPRRTYAVTIDDVVDVFYELSRPGAYPSLFDHPTLGFMRRMHEEYGAVFSLYLFYRGNIFADFDLARTTDGYRQEWQDNADWLRLGFHARSALRPQPYRSATYGRAAADYAEVQAEVRRFAGEGVWDAFLRSHWWAGSAAACRAWRDAGTRGLYAAVEGYESYYLDAAATELTRHCDYWRDHVEDLVFAQTDLWVERDFAASESEVRTSPARVVSLLDSLSRQPAGGHHITVLAHEFFPHGHPELWHVADRLEECIAWLSGHGYQPRLAADDAFLADLPPAPPVDVRVEAGAGQAVVRWHHARPGDGLQYRVVARDRLVPRVGWTTVGQTADLSLRVEAAPPNQVYRVFAVDRRGRWSGGSHAVAQVSSWGMNAKRAPAAAPGQFSVSPNYPNPFNLGTSIRFELAEAGEVELSVYDLRGNRVAQLAAGWHAAGVHELSWDGRDSDGQRVATGSYLYRLRQGAETATRRLMVLK
ncbi:MAG: FlgD immunoglobulin-like domain containing protein [Gemmatimonadota bacterium]